MSKPKEREREKDMMNMETIHGTIDDLRGPYGKSGNWYIAKIMPGMQTVTGVFPPVSVGDFCEFTGKRISDPKYGEQFKAQTCRMTYPKTETGIRKYFILKCPGIGPAICDRLFDWLKGNGKQAEDIWDILRNSPEHVRAVKGISQNKLNGIIEWFAENEGRRETDLFFVQNGITPGMLARIKSAYGIKEDKKVISLIKENPYALADDVHGIGFLKADKIAAAMGIAKDNPFRLQAGVAWVLSEAASQGNVFLPENEFTAKAVKLLDAEINAVKKATAAAKNNLRIIVDGKAVYLPELHSAEKKTVRRLRRIIQTAGDVIPDALTAEEMDKIDPDQLSALFSVFRWGVVIITGGPGVGKTYLLKMILRSLAGKLRIRLAAPTGKAAKRMTESTGHPASTIHRLLEYSRSKGTFTRNEENPLDADMVIIDETSMLDISLAADLLAAIPDGCRIVFVGDKDQLPSVGPGTVLGDMISSGKIPVAELKTLHRQDAGSAIDRAARDMNAGIPMPVDRNRAVSMPYGGNNFVYHRADDAAKVPALIKCYIEKIIKNTKYKLEDIQVLAPQKNTCIGVEALNTYLRDNIYNPDGKQIGNTGFRIGDKVMQIRNNYDLEVFNGEIGTITGFLKVPSAIMQGVTETRMDTVVIDFDDRVISYPLSYFEELRCAYCFTIHKSQGSEFPVLIMPVHSAHMFMISRELIYTGISRGKHHVVIIGTDKAIYKAAKKPNGTIRFSGLKERMMQWA